MDREQDASETGNALESALIDQRMRADRHRANFESLKAQHLALQESHQYMKLEFESLSKSYDALHHKSQEIIRTLQKERDVKIIECEELKPQILTSLKLEQLRGQLADELEEPYRQQLALIENEQEALKSEHNKLKYDYAFLKAEHQTTLVTHQSVVQELITKHDAELSALIQEKKALLARQERDVPTDLQRIRQLQRENSELQQRITGLISENEELVSQQEYSNTQNGQSQQVQSRQLAEMKAQIKAKELECSSQGIQIQALQSELNKAHHQYHTLNDQFTQCQREVSKYKRRFEELEHQNDMDISSLKMKHAEHCHKLEKEKEHYVQEWQSGQAQLDALQKAIEEHQLLLADKEHEVEQRVQDAREKEWEKLVGLERTKVELEERVAELQRLQAQSKEESKIKLQKLEDYSQQLQASKCELESEIEVTKFQCQQKAQQLQSLSAEAQQLSVISRKYQTLLAEHTSLQRSESEMQEVKKKLDATVQLLEIHLQKAHEDAQTAQERLKQELERERQLWVEEKKVFSDRMEECLSHQQALAGQLDNANKKSKRVLNHYRKRVLELKQSVEVLKAKEEEVKIEKEAVKKATGLENQKLQRKLSEMERKHKEFLFLLHHVDLNSSLTALVPSSRTKAVHQLWQTQENVEYEDKKHNEEESVGDINSDMIASGEQQQLLLQQLAVWPDTQHSSPSHSESLLLDSPR